MGFRPRPAVMALETFEERLAWAMLVFPPQHPGWPTFKSLMASEISQRRKAGPRKNHAIYFGLLGLYDISDWEPLAGAGGTVVDDESGGEGARLPLRRADALPIGDKTTMKLQKRYKNASEWFTAACESDDAGIKYGPDATEPWFDLFCDGAKVPDEVRIWIRAQPPGADGETSFKDRYDGKRVSRAALAGGESDTSPVARQTVRPAAAPPIAQPILVPGGIVVRNRAGELTSLDGELSSVPGAVIDVRARVVALQVGDEIEIAWIGHATAREIPWPEAIEADDVNEVLAIATAGGTEAYLVTTGPGGTALHRATQDGRLRQVRQLAYEAATAAVVHGAKVLLALPAGESRKYSCEAFRTRLPLDYLDAAWSDGVLTMVAGVRGATELLVAGVLQPVVSPQSNPIQEVRVVRQLDPHRGPEVQFFHTDGSFEVAAASWTAQRAPKGWL